MSAKYSLRKNQLRNYFLSIASSFLFLNLTAQEHSTYYHQRKSLFESLPDTPDEIIFLGNSITDGCNWSELFNDLRIKNRGISGDVTQGILDRLSEVASSKPDKVFLMIGVNDLARGKQVADISDNYRSIIETILNDSPQTRLYLQSVLPVNSDFGKFQNHVNKGAQIILLNLNLKSFAKQFNLIYIDLYSSFADENGMLESKYTNDGLHLTSEGYLLWKSIIEKHITN